MIDPLLLEGLPDGFRITHRLADSTVAKGINAAGDIVGWYSRGSAQHGFLYSGGTYATIHILGDTSAHGINDLGHVVGSYMEPLGNNYFRFHGFCYIINSHVTIDHPPPCPRTPILRLN
jgi:probable HAF family extracellular repeat protein